MDELKPAIAPATTIVQPSADLGLAKPSETAATSGAIVEPGVVDALPMGRSPTTTVQPHADLGVAKPSETAATSGAIVEPGIIDAIPMDHPAIDSEPRKGLPEHSFRIDLNDPTF